MKGLACLGIAVAASGAIVVGSIMNGWVLSVMWGWFVVPLFELPPLTIPYAIGISMVVGMLAKNSVSTKNEKKETSELVGEIIGVILAPLFVLFMGWIVKLFIQ